MSCGEGRDQKLLPSFLCVAIGWLAGSIFTSVTRRLAGNSESWPDFITNSAALSGLIGFTCLVVWLFPFRPLYARFNPSSGLWKLPTAVAVGAAFGMLMMLLCWGWIVSDSELMVTASLIGATSFSTASVLKKRERIHTSQEQSAS